MPFSLFQLKIIKKLFCFVNAFKNSLTCIIKLQDHLHQIQLNNLTNHPLPTRLSIITIPIRHLLVPRLPLPPPMDIVTPHTTDKLYRIAN